MNNARNVQRLDTVGIKIHVNASNNLPHLPQIESSVMIYASAIVSMKQLKDVLCAKTSRKISSVLSIAHQKGTALNLFA